MIHRLNTTIIAGLIGLALVASAAWAQGTNGDNDQSAAMITLNFPENFDLKVLIDYVGQRQNINFIYDNQVAVKKVTIKTSTPIPADSLMTLFTGILKTHQLTLVETDVPGTMLIKPTNEITQISVGPTEDAPAGNELPSVAMTRVFHARHADTQTIAEIILPFLSTVTSKVHTIPQHDLVIVTDFVGNMKRIEDLFNLVDQPKRAVAYEFRAIKHLSPAVANNTLTQLLTGGQRAQGNTKDKDPAAVTIITDDHARQLILVGRPEDVTHALGLLDSIDQPNGTTMEVYRFEVASPEKIDNLVRKIIGDETAKRIYQSATDLDTGLLIATTTPEVHAHIAKLQLAMDKAPTDAQSPIRFYKLKNATAGEVIDTLREIEGDSGFGDISIDGVAADPAADFSRINSPTADQINNTSTIGQTPSSADSALDIRNDEIGLGTARVFAHEPSNTVIVIARPSMHPVYEKLINRLDVRRPQVLVEATIVAIDTTDGFELGVEILRAGGVNDEGRYLTFSSFGLSSDVDPSDPTLVLKPGVGFNGAILTADIADIVIRALDSDTRAKVISRPSLLVNDNATGELVSENEEPFSSINASNTVSSTSFGGFAAAGTSIKVKPQISEGDHLKLEYAIELSSFAEVSSVGSGSSSSSSDSSTVSADLPPARQTNKLSSEATFPNGYTIVVGGLTRETLRDRIDRVPILGEIPVIEYAFSDRSNTAQQTTLFVFINATILRDDKFKDLRYVSGHAATDAELEDGFPESEPVALP